MSVVHKKQQEDDDVSLRNKQSFEKLKEFSGRPILHFKGLFPSYAAYANAITSICSCDQETCSFCRIPLMHRCLALQQPYSSVMYKTPYLYSYMFKLKDVLETPYHTLIVGYSAVYSHLRDLVNPECPMLDATWRSEARESRIKARDTWAPYVNQFNEDLKDAFQVRKDEEEGRRKLISAYERVIASGLCACTYPDREEFEQHIDAYVDKFHTKELTLGTMMKRAKGRKSEIDEFNEKQLEWKLMSEVEEKLRV
jgi:hypothetical protein